MAIVAAESSIALMFNPLPNANYVKINEAGYVSNEDIVLAVERNGEAVAYPVRLMAYHHLVEDVVGGMGSESRTNHHIPFSARNVR